MATLLELLKAAQNDDLKQKSGAEGGAAHGSI